MNPSLIPMRKPILVSVSLLIAIVVDRFPALRSLVMGYDRSLMLCAPTSMPSATRRSQEGCPCRTRIARMRTRIRHGSFGTHTKSGFSIIGIRPRIWSLESCSADYSADGISHCMIEKVAPVGSWSTEKVPTPGTVWAGTRTLAPRPSAFATQDLQSPTVR